MAKPSQSLAFCLQYNNHKSDMIDAFDDMLKSENMVDVILSCQGKTLKAHRMVLSAGSPYFRNIFSAFTNPLHYPVVIIKDMPFSDLKAIVEFLYRGEVIVPADRVSSLSKSAQTLLIKGLEKYFNKSAIVDFNGESGDNDDISNDEGSLQNAGDGGNGDDPSSSGKKRRRRRKRRSGNSGTNAGNGSSTNESCSDEDEQNGNEMGESTKNSRRQIVGTIKTEHRYDINYIEADDDDDGDGPPHLEQMEDARTDEQMEDEFEDENDAEIDNDPKRMVSSANKSNGPVYASSSNSTLFQRGAPPRMTTMISVSNSPPSSLLTNSLQEPRGIIKNPTKIAPRKVKTPFMCRYPRRKRMGRHRSRNHSSSSANTNSNSTGPRTMLMPIKTEPDSINLIYCSQCPKVFSQINSLNLHVKRIHGDNEKEHACDICGKRYSWRSGLYKHLRSHRN